MNGAPEGAAIVRLDADGFARRREALIDILIDCVESDASVGFVLPLSRAEAGRYWDGLGAGVTSGAVLIWAALDADGGTAGTVQLHPITKTNQPHRAEIAKLLVPRHARRRGLGRALMLAAEAEALALGRWLLVLDTAVGGGAEALYESLGWTVFGVCPDYAQHPDGRFCDAAFSFKRLR